MSTTQILHSLHRRISALENQRMALGGEFRERGYIPVKEAFQNIMDKYRQLDPHTNPRGVTAICNELEGLYKSFSTDDKNDLDYNYKDQLESLMYELARKIHLNNTSGIDVLEELITQRLNDPGNDEYNKRMKENWIEQRLIGARHCTMPYARGDHGSISDGDDSGEERDLDGY